MPYPFLFVGLDYEEPCRVADLAEELAKVDRKDYGFKLNLDFIVNSGLSGDKEPFQRVIDTKKPLFLDLKMWNGRRTMASIIMEMRRSGANIQYTNAYALAEDDFLRGTVGATKGSNIKLLGITVLTHYTEEYCRENFGSSLSSSVRHFAEISYKAGCHGIILPGTTLEVVKDLPFEKMVPAVRPSFYGKTGDNYQEQETFVKEAVTNGANLLVCSSPIRKSENKREALIKTLDEMYTI